MPTPENTSPVKTDQAIQNRNELVDAKPELAASFAKFSSSYERFRKTQDQLQGKELATVKKPSMRYKV